MIAFCDLPDNERFRLLYAIDDLGGSNDAYQDDCIQIALPRDWRPFVDAIAKLGLVMVPGSRYQFPLGTDKAPDHQRHDGSYPGSKGYWMFAKFYCPDFCPM